MLPAPQPSIRSTSEKMKTSSILTFMIWKRAILSTAPNTNDIEIVGKWVEHNKFLIKYQIS